MRKPVRKTEGRRNRFPDGEGCFLSYLYDFILFKSFLLKITSSVVVHTITFCNKRATERRSLSSAYLDLFYTHDHFV